MSALRQGSAEWLEARREAVSSTDLPVILGLSRYKSEWELAAEKAGELEPQEATLPMRLGLAMEPFIREEYERETGERLRRVNVLVRHPEITWAVASPDYRVVGQPRLVEAKWSLAGRWGEGLPQDVEAQVQWALGVTRQERADVAALVGYELRIHPVEFDAELFRGLVEVAADFRARMAAGGPFGQTTASLKRRYPADSGEVIQGDAEIARTLEALLEVRARVKALEEDQDRLEVLVKERMADATALVVPGIRVTWKKEKERRVVAWQNIADGLLRSLPEEEREALVGLNTTILEGRRPLLVKVDRELEGSG